MPMGLVLATLSLAFSRFGGVSGSEPQLKDSTLRLAPRVTPPVTALYSFFVQNYDNPPYDLWIEWSDPTGATGRSFLAGFNGGYLGCCNVFVPGEVWVDAPAVPGNTYWLALVDISGAFINVASLGVATYGVVANETFTVNGGVLSLTGVTYSQLPPTVTMDPANQTITEGQEATFSVSASGLALTYQWLKNGSYIPGATAASYTTPPTTLADNRASFSVLVVNSGGSAASNAATLTVIPSPSTLPRPWLDQDVGALSLAGTASFDGASGTFTIAGSGAIVGAVADQFHYAFQPLTGDGEIRAHVTGPGNTNPWALAGVMIRESLNAGSTFAMTALTPSNGVVFGSRSSTGATPTTVAGPSVPAPYWVRLVRAGNGFTSFASPDGVTWTQLGAPVTIPMVPIVYIGLVVTSGTTSSSTPATFDQVTGSGGWGRNGPNGGGGGSGSNIGGCGTLGLEALMILGLLRAFCLLQDARKTLSPGRPQR